MKVLLRLFMSLTLIVGKLVLNSQWYLETDPSSKQISLSWFRPIRISSLSISKIEDVLPSNFLILSILPVNTVYFWNEKHDPAQVLQDRQMMRQACVLRVNRLLKTFKHFRDSHATQIVFQRPVNGIVLIEYNIFQYMLCASGKCWLLTQRRHNLDRHSWFERIKIIHR